MRCYCRWCGVQCEICKFLKAQRKQCQNQKHLFEINCIHACRGEKADHTTLVWWVYGCYVYMSNIDHEIYQFVSKLAPDGGQAIPTCSVYTAKPMLF